MTLKKGLSLYSSTMIIIGSMIGSGIFIVSADIAAQVQSPFYLLLAWIVTAIITVSGALCIGELASAMPKAGGQYVYLKEIYNPLIGFLYGWTLFAVIQTGTIAAVGVAFAKFTGVFFPVINSQPILFNFISTQQILGISVIILLSIFNFRKVESGAIMQNIFTGVKLISLATLIILGFYYSLTHPFMDVIQHFKQSTSGSGNNSITFGIFSAALVGALFSADAWNNITFTAGEIENPSKNIPKSLIIGTGVVLLIYILINITYIAILGMDAIANAPEKRVATLMSQQILGNVGLYLMAGVIMVSTFGCLNGIILTGSRVYYAMAKDNAFFKTAAKLNKNDVPSNSLIMQCIWACILTLTGSYSDLLDYVVFAVLLFYIIAIAGIIVHRRKDPNLIRPYKVMFYPYLPILYCVLAGTVCVSLLIYKTAYAGMGLAIVLTGIPIYFLFVKRRKREVIID